MDNPHSLTFHERLRRRGAIRRLFESGKSGFVYPLRYMWYTEPGSEEILEQGSEQGSEQGISCQVLFTVPKRFHKRANKRNLLRRRVKESYRLNKSMLLSLKGAVPCKIEMAIIYSTKEAHSYKTIDAAVKKILSNVAQGL